MVFIFVGFVVGVKMLSLEFNKPFYRVKESNPDDKSRVITIRINQDEEGMIKHLRAVLDVEAEGKALKIASKIGYFVLLNVFGEEIIKYLSSTKRERKSDYEKVKKPDNSDFVIQKEA